MAKPLRDLFKDLARSVASEWLETQPAWTGKWDETVLGDSPGKIWVRLVNGKELEAYNQLAPNRFDVPVKIGRSRTLPNIWQVIEVREFWDTPAASGEVAYHHLQHEFGAGDTVWVDRKQVLVMDVLADGTSFTVQVYGGIIRTGDAYIQVDNQTFDLSAYAVTAGAAYVNIEADEDGVLLANVGENFYAPGAGTPDDIPIPSEGHALIAVVLMYESQTALSNSDIFIPWSIERGGMGAQIFSSARKPLIVDNDLIGFYKASDGRLRSISFSDLKGSLRSFVEGYYALALQAVQSLNAWIIQTLADYLKVGDTAGGDLTGTYPDPTVAKIRGLDVVSPLSPTDGDSLVWVDANQRWEPGSGSGFVLTIEEQDTAPSVSNVTTIKVTNATLTDEGGGVVSIDTGGGVGSGANPVLAVMDLLGWA